MSVVTTSVKGQLVIPKKAREKAGIRPGSKIILEVVGDHIEIRALPEDPVDHFCGIFEEGPSLTESLLKERKGDASREEEKAVRFIRPSLLPKQRKGA